MKRTILGALFILCAGVLMYMLFFRARQQEASMLMVNGIVYTLSDAQPVAEAVAIDGDRIVGVGVAGDPLREA